MGVVNRSQADINEAKSMRDARAAEDAFFSKTYASVADRCGTRFLVKRCSELLADHIRVSLPTLERELDAALAAKKKALVDLGDQTPAAKKRKLTEALLAFCDRYAALVTGAGSLHGAGHPTGELSGGARIEAVFRDVFAAEVRSVAVLDDLAPLEVQTLVRNVQGLGGGLFTPDRAFTQLVARNVRRLRAPATHCVELVHAELLKLVDAAADFDAFSQFPDLRAATTVLVAERLRERLDHADASRHVINVCASSLSWMSLVRRCRRAS